MIAMSNDNHRVSPMLSSQTKTVRAILSYLVEHEGAADTFEGIMRWWMLHEDVKKRILFIQESLDFLVGKEMIQKRSLPGSSEVLYYVEPTKIDQIQTWLGELS
jgi:hypothetical protein